MYKRILSLAMFEPVDDASDEKALEDIVYILKWGGVYGYLAVSNTQMVPAELNMLGTVTSIEISGVSYPCVFFTVSSDAEVTRRFGDLT